MVRNRDIPLLIGGVVIAGVVGAAALVAVQAKPVSWDLPHEPYPVTTLPITSKFEQRILDPFKLLSVFYVPEQHTPSVGQGRVWFHDNVLEYNSYDWSWLAVRTAKPQNIVNVKFVWKALNGNTFICEAWNANPNLIGHTAMIIFENGIVKQAQYPSTHYLMNLDPSIDWVTTQMRIDYGAKTIRDLWINDTYFTNLLIGDEPIGQVPTPGYWQFQMFLPKYASVLMKEMSAW